MSESQPASWPSRQFADLRQDSGGLALLTTLAGLVGAVVWASYRGLDLSDEGYYLQLYANPDSAPISAATSQFYVIVDLLTGPFEPGVVGYRIAGLVVTLLSALLLGHSVYRFSSVYLPRLASALPARSLAFSFIAIASILGYIWTPLTPSYNNLTAVLVNFGASLTLLALAASGPAVRRIALAAAGGTLPLLFYTKWPAAVLMAAVIATLVVGVLGWRRAIGALVAFAASAACTMVILTQEAFGGRLSIDSIRGGTALAAATDEYEPAGLALESAKLILDAVTAPLYERPYRLAALVALMAGGALSRMIRKRWDAPSQLEWIIRGAGAAVLLLEIPSAPYLADGFNHLKIDFVSSIPAALAITSLLVHHERSNDLRYLKPNRYSRDTAVTVLFVAALVGFAMLTAAGTANHPVLNALVGAAPLGAATVVVLALIAAADRGDSQSLWGFALPVVTLVLAVQVLTGVVVAPYRLGGPRTDQTVPLSGVAAAADLRFDQPRATALGDLTRAVERTSYRPGDYVITVGWLPGLVYLLDGVTPGTPWIPPSKWADQGPSCRALREDADRVGQTRLLLVHGSISPPLHSCLADLIDGYPGSVAEAATVDLRVWYPDIRYTDTELRVLEITE